MTLEMQNALQRELDDAKAIADPSRRHEAIEMVQSHMLAALIDCQRKTSDRVKQILADAESAKAKVQGAKLLWQALRYIAAIGGGGLLVKLIGG